MSRHPTVKWAQRSDKLFITVELPDAKNVKLKLEPEGKFFFSATAGADNVPYEVDLDLFDKINVDESKSSSTSRNIVYLVKKVEDKWWSRLIKQEGLRLVFLKVDWDKWVDEDEEDGKPGPDMDFGDLDFSNLNMGEGPSDFDADVPEGDDDDSDTEEVKEEDISAGPDMDFDDLDFSNLNMGEGPSDLDAALLEGDDDDSDTDWLKEEEDSAHSEPKSAVPPSTEPEAKA